MTDLRESLSSTQISEILSVRSKYERRQLIFGLQESSIEVHPSVNGIALTTGVLTTVLTASWRVFRNSRSLQRSLESSCGARAPSEANVVGTALRAFRNATSRST